MSSEWFDRDVAVSHIRRSVVFMQKQHTRTLLNFKRGQRAVNKPAQKTQQGRLNAMLQLQFGIRAAKEALVSLGEQA